MIPPPLRILLICACISLPAVAQLEDSDQATQAACKQYVQTPLPGESSNIPVPKQWPDCNSYKLYSGIGTTVDLVAARKCAWSERLAQGAGLEPRYTVASVFGGSAMLAVLYANGEGIPQDIKLAERFVCEAGGAPAEIHIRLDHVATLAQKAPALSTKFGFCDDITSGFMQGFCAAYISELEDQKQESLLHNITSNFTSEQMRSFQSLRNAQEAYAKAHARGEIDLGGTARAMYQIDAEDALRQNFIAALDAFENRNLPSASNAEYKDADRKLNAAYRQAISNAETTKDDYGAVQPEGIRHAERAWLRYRDAFVAFARLRYPNIPVEAWLTLLTKDRTSILEGSFCGHGRFRGLLLPAWRHMETKSVTLESCTIPGEFS